jgi:hypothetical protein
VTMPEPNRLRGSDLARMVRRVHEPHTGFSRPMPGTLGAVAVITFVLIFMLIAGTYVRDAQERRDDACGATDRELCDEARRDANVAIGVTIGIAGLAGIGVFLLTGRLVRRSRTSF